MTTTWCCCCLLLEAELCDRTLDLGFEKELSVILNSINATGRADRTCDSFGRHLSQRSVNIHMSGSASSDLTVVPDVTSDPGPGSQSESFAVPEALRQFVVVVPSPRPITSLRSASCVSMAT
ncbi:hypothetical protein INR49_023200 [Caranx melampygus]|nr:hypothetical protein INR49_023200 [Caranx melampygus]